MKKLDPRQILEITDRIGSSLTFEHTERKHSAVCLFDLAHEHATSIAILVDQKKSYGSAYALLRSCIEAYVRGSWLLNCATDEEIKKFTYKNTQWPKLAKQYSDLEEHHETPGLFERYVGRTMGTLDALTHGLSEQILKRRNGKSIEIVMSKEEIQHLLREVSLISILATSEFAGIAENQEALDEIARLQNNF